METRGTTNLNPGMPELTTATAAATAGTRSNSSSSSSSSSRASSTTLLLVSTSQPPAVATSSASGALTMICPRSGTVQNSLRIQGSDLRQTTNSTGTSSGSGGGNNSSQLGISNISLFPRNNNNSSADPSSRLAIAYGSSSTTNKKRGNGALNDSYGMLLTIRRTGAPILHWKCRLPETNMSGGLLVSPVTSRHIVGGGHSGTLYVWDALMLPEGTKNLVRTIPSAHYRAIACLQWSVVDGNAVTSPSDCHLITGGADGMVHVFSHVDLVEPPTSSSAGQGNSIQPIRTWTKHHLAVSALTAMNGGRMASAAEDGQVVVMELHSGATLATIQLPDAIRALTTDSSHGCRLFAGSVKGTVHIVDLDSYAIHRTVQMGATIVHIPKHQQHQTTSLEDRVFGTSLGPVASNSDESSFSYLAELRGHDRAISSLAVFDEDTESGSIECLISGDESGVIRVWDSMRGCCVRVIHPWWHSTLVDNAGDNNKSKSTTKLYPVTSISVLRDEVDPFDASSNSNNASMFDTQSKDKRKKCLNNFGSMVLPLQKFAASHDDRDSSALPIKVPFLEPRRDDVSGFWDLSSSRLACENALRARHKRNRQKRSRHYQPEIDDVDIKTAVNDSDELQQQRDEVAKLKKELEEAKSTIGRWEIVNNKLMSKIQQVSTQP